VKTVKKRFSFGYNLNKGFKASLTEENILYILLILSNFYPEAVEKKKNPLILSK